MNHINPETKDIILGRTIGLQFEWYLHNLAALFGEENAKDLDVGKSIFADGKSHPLKNDEGKITKEGVMSLVMRIGYILFVNPVYWIWDLIVNGGF